LHDYLKTATPRSARRINAAAIVSACWMVVSFAPFSPLKQATITPSAATLIELTGFLCGAVVAGNLYHRLTVIIPRLDGFMPLAWMAGIVYFTTVTTAAGRDNLLRVGLLLFLAAALHNAAGYFFGYWLSRASGLDKNSANSRRNNPRHCA